MRSNDGTRTGGEILIDQLAIQGVTHAFCVPGESYLAALDALHDSTIKLTVCRHESAAAMAAEAIGKATGRPGICFVTRGPGATNGSAGVHIARQDSTPMIMFVGQIGREMRDREAFQELDYRAVFGTMAKWATEIDDPARIPEIVQRAFHTACNGRPGPVVIALPEDMLTERVVTPDARAVEPVEIWPGLTDMSRLQKLLWAAKRPVVMVGGSRWSEQATAALMRFAERFQVPVTTTFRRGHLFDALHPCYAGDFGIGPNPKLLARVKAADLVLLIGSRMSEMPSQSYTLFDIPEPQVKLVHVHPGSEELGRVYHPFLAINASPTAFCSALEGLQPPNEIPWKGESDAAHADFLAWTEKATPQPGNVNLGACMTWLRDNLSRDAIITVGAGNFTGWVHRFYRVRQYGGLIGPTSGSMGYGFPAALGLQTLYPDRTVVCVAGDGDFLMTGQDFATAVQCELPIVIVLYDNSLYGTIRMHQEREYPGRVIATHLRNPDFADYAKAFGGFGVRVERTEDFPAAFEAARKSGKPSIVHLKVDPEALTPGMSLSAIRDKALAGK
ncbi:thiamine pyrophosphate-binding protein [Pseudolabrys taiwanensis]|uniref:Thiamine pyrophosphate-binding protein n=1 Tax=Pseudolabrys taiwanensis TaxID=331696 RepID=A0A345ZVQ1_9HYPH|nr:thiamine pyrophosphate-binding protein [Pseudolabrys taiwanensis]AXK80998.1 thiamine pyrophosphate-binding protein [Pseudolabrys taiwanensis]